MLFLKLEKPRSGFEPGLNRSAGDCVTAPPPWQPAQSNTVYEYIYFLTDSVLLLTQCHLQSRFFYELSTLFLK